MATGVARKEAQKAGGRELRVALEQKAPGIAPLNKRESQLIDTAEAIARAVNREANQNALVGVKTIGSLALGGATLGGTNDPYLAALTSVAARMALRPAVATRAAIIAYRLGTTHTLVPASAMRLALQAIQNTAEGVSEAPAPALAP